MEPVPAYPARILLHSPRALAVIDRIRKIWIPCLMTNATDPSLESGIRPAAGAQAMPPVLAIAGWSGAGKTTLLTVVIPLLRSAGIRVALVKHAHHRFDVDHPGKDSFRLRKAGADQVLLTSGRRFALMVERPAERDPVLQEELRRIDWQACDLILVEGFRDGQIPKLEVHRPLLGRPLLAATDPHILGIATDTPAEIHTGLPVLDLNAPEGIVRFILSATGLTRAADTLP